MVDTGTVIANKSRQAGQRPGQLLFLLYRLVEWIYRRSSADQLAVHYVLKRRKKALPRHGGPGQTLLPLPTSILARLASLRPP